MNGAHIGIGLAIILLWASIDVSSLAYVLIAAVIIVTCFMVGSFYETPSTMNQNADEYRQNFEKKVSKREKHDAELKELLQVSGHINDNGTFDHTKTIEAVAKQHGALLLSERSRLLLPDKYGEIDSASQKKWEAVLFEIITMSPIANKKHYDRNSWSTAVSLFYLYPASLKENFDDLIESNEELFEIQNTIAATQNDVLDRIKLDITLAFDKQFPSLRLNTNQVLSSTSYNKGLVFEEDCLKILNDDGWSVKSTPASGDQGADLIATKGVISVAIQCKNFSGKVGNTAVQEVFSSLSIYGVSHGAVVSNGEYTKGARTSALLNKIVLLRKEDLPSLHQILKESL